MYYFLLIKPNMNELTTATTKPPSYIFLFVIIFSYECRFSSKWYAHDINQKFNFDWFLKIKLYDNRYIIFQNQYYYFNCKIEKKKILFL